MQCGNFSLNPSFSHDCHRKIGPYGGLNSSTLKIQTVLQVDHYYSPHPGQLDISFAIGLNPEEKDFRILISFNDYDPMNPNTQKNFSIEIHLPNKICDYYILRAHYLTNNPNKNDHKKNILSITLNVYFNVSNEY